MKTYNFTVQGHGTMTFTNKKQALTEAKKHNISTENIYILDIPADGFIKEMKYQYRKFIKNGKGYDIYKAYQKPSQRKVKTYMFLRNMAINNDCRVLSANCFKYTTGMIIIDNSIGEYVFRVDTAEKVKTIPLSYLEN